MNPAPKLTAATLLCGVATLALADGARSEKNMTLALIEGTVPRNLWWSGWNTGTFGNGTGGRDRRGIGPGTRVGMAAEVGQRDPGPDIEHSGNLSLADPERRCGVCLPEEQSAVGTDRRVRPGTQLGSASRRSLSRDEPLSRVGIPSGEHAGEVVALHCADQPRLVGGAPQPSAGLLAAVRVVARRSV